MNYIQRIDLMRKSLYDDELDKPLTNCTIKGLVNTIFFNDKLKPAQKELMFEYAWILIMFYGYSMLTSLREAITHTQAIADMCNLPSSLDFNERDWDKLK